MHLSLLLVYEVWGSSAIPALQPDTLVPYALGYGDNCQQR